MPTSLFTHLKNVGSNSNQTVEQLSSKVDSVGSSLRKDIDKVVWSFSHGVGSLKRWASIKIWCIWKMQIDYQISFTHIRWAWISTESRGGWPSLVPLNGFIRGRSVGLEGRGYCTSQPLQQGCLRVNDGLCALS